MADNPNSRRPRLDFQEVMEKTNEILEQYERRRGVKSVEEFHQEAVHARMRDRLQELERERVYITVPDVTGQTVPGEIRRFEALYQKLIPRQTERIGAYQRRMAETSLRHQFALQKQFVGSVSTMVGSRQTMAEISRQAMSPSFAAWGEYYADEDYGVLRENFSNVSRNLYRQESDIIQAAQTADTPEGRKEFERLMGRRQTMINQASTFRAALRHQERTRTDPRSVMYAAGQTLTRLSAADAAQAQYQAILSGGTGTFQEESAKLGTIRKDLTEAYSAFSVALREGTKDIGKLSKEVNQLNTQYKEQEKLVTTMQRMGMGAGGGGFFGTAVNMLGGSGVLAASRLAQATGQVMLHANVTTEIEQTRLRAQFAQAANQRFDWLYRAPEDAQSFRRIATDLFGAQTARGQGIRGSAATALGVHLGGTVGEILHQGVQAGIRSVDPTVGGIGAAGGKIVGAAGAGFTAGANVVSAIANPGAAALNQGISLYKGIPQGRAELQMRDAMLALDEQMFRVTDMSVQTAMNQLQSMTMATRGLGGGAFGGARNRVPVSGSGVWTGLSGFIGAADAVSNISSTFTGMGDFASYMGGLPQNERIQALKNAQASADPVTRNLANRFANTADAWHGLMSQPGLPKSPLGNIEGAINLFQRRGAVHRNRGFAISGPSGSQPVRTASEGQQRLNAGGLGAGISNMIDPGVQSNREMWMNFLMDPGNVSNLARTAGLSMRDLAGVVGAGRDALGSGFLTSDVTMAGQYARAGYMASPEQFIQARGALGSVGAGERQGQERFAEILASAIGNKIDSSKNIMALVQATTRLAEGGVVAGADITPGASRMITGMTQSLLGLGVAKESVATTAQYAAMMAKTMGTSTDMDIANIMEAADVRRNFGGASVQEQELLQRMDPTVVNSMVALQERVDSATNPEERARLQQQLQRLKQEYGVAGVLKTGKDVRTARNITNRQIRNRSLGIGTGLNQNMIRRLDAWQAAGSIPTPSGANVDFSYENLQKYYPEMYNQARGASWLWGGGTHAMGVTMDGKSNLGAPNLTPGGMTGAGEDVRAQAGIRDAKMFENGVQELNKVVGGLQGFAETLKRTLEESFKPENLARFAQEAGMTGEMPGKSFGESTAVFKSSVEQFSGAVEKLSKQLGINTGGLQDSNTDKRLMRPGERR